MYKYLFIVPMFLFVPFMASAATPAGIYINSISAPGSVAGGADMDVTVEVNRVGSGCSNNWLSTDIKVDGTSNVFTYGPLDHTQGSAVESETHTVKAPNAGSGTTHTLEVSIYSGDETPSLGCSATLKASTSTTFDIQNPLPVKIIGKGHRSGGSSLICSEKYGRHFVMETSNGETYKACRPITQAPLGSSVPLCQLLSKGSTNGANYCTGATPAQIAFWESIRGAIERLFGNK